MWSNAFHLLPYMAIARQLATTGKGRELTELSFWVWGPGNVTLCRAVLEFDLLAGLKSRLSFPLGAAQTASQVMYWYEIWFPFGDCEFSLDLSSFGIPDRLSSENFGAHRWCDVGVGERGRLSAFGYLCLFFSVCSLYKFMLNHDVCVCRVEEIL
jgi:hypothetical protein